MNIVAPEKADNIIQAMNRFIALDKNESQNSYKCLKEILDQLLHAMKERDVIFEKNYRKLVWAGSYWDNLKVGNPDEYDIDIVLGIPTKYYSMEVCNSRGLPGFVKVKLTENVRNQNNPNKMNDLQTATNHVGNKNEDIIHWEKFINSERFLLQNKIRYWFEGVVYKGLDSFPRASENSWWIREPVEELFKTCQVSISKSGPAMTLIVNAGNEFSVDLVPVIEMKTYPPPPFCKHIREKELPNWYVVPKPKQNKKSDDSWRCSFLYHEKKLLHDTQILKPALKLVKKFRDRQNLQNISSYFIKTVFMWETLEQKNNHTFYKMRQIDMFLRMLSKLRDYFREGNIPYLWNKHFNLLSDWSASTCQNIYGKINNILLKIERNIQSDPEILINILLTESEAERFKFGRISMAQTITDDQEVCQSPTSKEPSLCILL